MISSPDFIRSSSTSLEAHYQFNLPSYAPDQSSKDLVRLFLTRHGDLLRINLFASSGPSPDLADIVCYTPSKTRPPSNSLHNPPLLDYLILLMQNPIHLIRSRS